MSDVIDQVKQRLVDRGLTVLDRVPLPEQDRQIVQGRGMMYRGRVAEHKGAVADDGHDRAVRVRKLGAKRCSGAPTKS